jgi:hypothetical protein
MQAIAVNESASRTYPHKFARRFPICFDAVPREIVFHKALEAVAVFHFAGHKQLGCPVNRREQKFGQRQLKEILRVHVFGGLDSHDEPNLSKRAIDLSLD